MTENCQYLQLVFLHINHLVAEQNANKKRDKEATENYNNDGNIE